MTLKLYPEKVDKPLLVPGSKAPRIEDVAASSGRSVFVAWHGGRQDIVDLAPILNVLAKHTAANLAESVFRSVSTGQTGDDLRWSDGGSGWLMSG